MSYTLRIVFNRKTVHSFLLNVHQFCMIAPWLAENPGMFAAKVHIQQHHGFTFKIVCQTNDVCTQVIAAIQLAIHAIDSGVYPGF